MKDFDTKSLDTILTLERRPVKVLPDESYIEIGMYSYGRGIFHKTPRLGIEVGDKDLFLIKEGDFIFQITFAWEGAVGLASSNENNLYGSVRFPTFRVNENICFPKYLVYYFRTPDGRNQLIKISPGSAGRNRVLSLKKIPEIEIPLPPIEEQRRIVARIEELAAKIEEARGLRNEIQKDLYLLRRSVFFGSTKGKLIPTPMRDLLSLQETDVSVNPEETYHFAGIYSFGKGMFKGQRRTGTEFSYTRLTYLKTNNFVYPKLMAWEGALAIVPSECDGLVVSPEFPVFEVNQDKVLPETLEIYFQSPDVWPLLSGASTGTNVRRKRLNPSDFFAFEMPLPSMETQILLRDVNQRANVIKRYNAEATIELNALLPSILDKAFKGEL